VATISLSFLNRRAINKQVCRVCHEFTELKAERLCAECTQIKARLRLDHGDGARMAYSGEYQCKRSGCLCSGCGGRTLDAHSFYSLEPARRELHFHPRCHELWLELGVGARPATTLASSQA
jgi:hypothetical protein